MSLPPRPASASPGPRSVASPGPRSVASPGPRSVAGPRPVASPGPRSVAGPRPVASPGPCPVASPGPRRAAITRLTTVAIAAIACAAACGSSAADKRPAASGPLTPAELELLAHVPAGTAAVFGGDLFAAQRWLGGSALARLAPSLASPQAAAWNRCLADQRIASAGTVSARGAAVIVHVFLKELTLAKLETCARTAGAAIAADPDGRFAQVTLDTGGDALDAAFLAVDGGVLALLAPPLGVLLDGAPSPAPATRDDLELAVAALAQGSAATDPRFTAALARLDRTRTLWFAGDGADTGFGDRVGLAHGTIDVTRGLGLDVTATLHPPGAAADLRRRFHDARAQLDMVPVGFASVKELVRAIDLRRDGDTLHLTATFRDGAIADALDLVGDRFLRRR